jgi:hypothetical protein
MNLDPETLVLLDDLPVATIGASGSTLPVGDAGPDPMPPESVVGGPFFWASASVLVNLS